MTPSNLYHRSRDPFRPVTLNKDSFRTLKKTNFALALETRQEINFVLQVYLREGILPKWNQPLNFKLVNC